ncbi:glycosyltransferase family A protein [Flavobacterium sp. SLB02]|uniref:glycosyltransferase family A protein n=1 Tax=Flavobacterium sp. SLB02 TaxID=2665645 RepID=UPI0012AA5B4C|nr:glycosyltransferase family A protein [Flavobacterium sp. SLB02]QGK76877.1 glycosyltransferase [Flavobacterium sp. SLB02]
MRKGINPEKLKKEKNVKRIHRVVVLFFVPNVSDDYYKESVNVLNACLESIVNTINFETTCITLINNNSVADVNSVIDKYIDKGKIDKYVCYSENKGKVYAIMNEIRGIYEPFVTISDADVLFIKGWEKAVFNIYKNFEKAGVVAPLPSSNLAFDHNCTVFFDKIWSLKIKKDKIVSDKDCDIYLEGLGNDSLLNRNNRDFNWRTHQYYIKKNNDVAVLGSGHFVATYRTALINENHNFPVFKFFNGYEDEFIDDKADRKGYYRLSLNKTFAYHIGSRLDSNVDTLKNVEGKYINPEDFEGIQVNIKKRYTPYWLRSIVFRIIKKTAKL